MRFGPESTEPVPYEGGDYELIDRNETVSLQPVTIGGEAYLAEDRGNEKLVYKCVGPEPEDWEYKILTGDGELVGDWTEIKLRRVLPTANE